MRRTLFIILLAIIVAIAMGFGIAHDRAARARARDEAQLREELTTMRAAIRDFTKSLGRPPQTLRESMPSVPIDPITRSSTTWHVMTEESVRVDDFTAPAAPQRPSGIVDVHSGAAGRDSNGKPYSDY